MSSVSSAGAPAAGSHAQCRISTRAKRSVTRAFTASSPAVAGACARHAVPSEYKGTSSSGAAEAPPFDAFASSSIACAYGTIVGGPKSCASDDTPKPATSTRASTGARLARSLVAGGLRRRQPAGRAVHRRAAERPRHPQRGAVAHERRRVDGGRLAQQVVGVERVLVEDAHGELGARRRRAAVRPPRRHRVRHARDLHAFFSPSGVWNVSRRKRVRGVDAEERRVLVEEPARVHHADDRVVDRGGRRHERDRQS